MPHQINNYDNNTVSASEFLLFYFLYSTFTYEQMPHQINNSDNNLNTVNSHHHDKCRWVFILFLSLLLTTW